MRVLITCESSGVIREAFRADGNDAWSCDLQPADDGSPFHYQCDLRDVLGGGWDLVGFHPACKFLSGSGIHWNNRGRGWTETEKAVDFCRFLMSHDSFAWYLENPVGILSSRIRKPNQTIQPYNFGEDASKKTCLWLHRLPLLKGTSFFPPRLVCKACGEHSEYSTAFGKGCQHCGSEPGLLVPRWSNQTDSGQNKLSPSDNRWKERARSYPGIARAMADQWKSIS